MSYLFIYQGRMMYYKLSYTTEYTKRRLLITFGKQHLAGPTYFSMQSVNVIYKGRMIYYKLSYTIAGWQDPKRGFLRKFNNLTQSMDF